MFTAPMPIDVPATSLRGLAARFAATVRQAMAVLTRHQAPVIAAPMPAPVAAPVPVPRRDGAVPLIGAAVGSGRANRRADVAMVQRLIEAARAGGALPPAPPLAADGAFGPATAAALADAQRALTGGTDGAADPGGALIAALRAVAMPQGPSMQLLRLLWPSAPAGRLARLGQPLLAMMARRGIASDLRLAHFLTQIGHESGQLRWLEELASGAAYEGRRDLGNTRPGDGKRFKGRGLIQLTGRANYASFGAAMGCAAELLADPALVADDASLAVETAGWFWDANGLSPLADRDDLAAVTQRINGGLNGLMARAAMLARAKALLGL
jgi:putative chitinase